MGTRGFVGFVVDGIEKISYNHSDSYPSWLGVRVLAWLHQQDIATLREQARALELVNEFAKPAGSTEEWYEILHDDQGDLGAMLARGKAVDSLDFPLNSLHCEWGYLVDLDAEVFEVYKGMQRKLPTQGRWAGRPTMAENQAEHTLHVEWCAKHNQVPWLPETPEFKAVELFESWSLSALPPAIETSA